MKFLRFITSKMYFTGRNFSVSKKREIVDKTFPFADFWNRFSGINFREFKIKFVFA